MQGINSPAQSVPIYLSTKVYSGLEVKAKKLDTFKDSSYEIQTIGADPFIETSTLPAFNSDSLYFISFDYLAPTGLQNLEIYLGLPYSEYRSLKIGKLPPSSIYRNYRINVRNFSGFWNRSVKKLRFDIGNVAGEKISIKNIRITKPRPSEIDQQLEHKRREINAYLSRSFKNAVLKVEVNKTSVIIKGTVKEQNLYLGELAMFDEPSVAYSSFTSVTPITSSSSFEIKKERFALVKDSSYDRMFSRWVIVAKEGNRYNVKSFAHYADDIFNAALQYLPEEKPISKKGLAGFIEAGNTTPDLTDLNIKSTTVNIILPSLVSLTPTSYSYDLKGQKIYINAEQLSILDNTIKTCSDRGIIVSAIILIPQNTSKALKEIFVHPKAVVGMQSMANLTSISGFNFYRGVMSFLAERYGKLNKEHGRIQNWIIHNEVDMGYDWANAGKMSFENYSELYDRSLRTAYYATRQFNPSAKVFLSLTHYWNSTLNDHYFAPHQMLNLFIKLCKQQGDYEWGVAFHPYPQDLFIPQTWKDSDVTNDLETTDYITPKNIELIDEWMRKEINLYKGLKIRTLLFSEQGIHTPSYKAVDLEIQAAGVAYMWKKFLRLPSLEAFCYHRAVDVRSELGLLLGLRTAKPGTDSEPDEKKQSWQLYQKAGTQEEEKYFSFALPIIGVKNWNETFNVLKGETFPVTISFNVFKKGIAQNDITIEFNGEVRKTIKGMATFFNVADLSKARIYKIIIDKKIILEKSVVAKKNEAINIELSE